GGICISEDVERQVRSAVGVRVEKLAPAELKNIQLPMSLFCLSLGWEPRTTALASRASRKLPIKNIAIAALILVALLAAASFWFLKRDSTKMPAALKSIA